MSWFKTFGLKDLKDLKELRDLAEELEWIYRFSNDRLDSIWWNDFTPARAWLTQFAY